MTMSRRTALASGAAALAMAPGLARATCLAHCFLGAASVSTTRWPELTVKRRFTECRTSLRFTSPVLQLPGSGFHTTPRCEEGTASQTNARSHFCAQPSTDSWSQRAFHQCGGMGGIPSQAGKRRYRKFAGGARTRLGIVHASGALGNAGIWRGRMRLVGHHSPGIRIGGANQRCGAGSRHRHRFRSGISGLHCRTTAHWISLATIHTALGSPCRRALLRRLGATGR